MKDISYVIGRLQGLNELVKILKDLVDKKGGQNSEIIAVVTDHVSEQLDSILNEFDSLEVEPEHKEKLAELREKHAESSRKPVIDESTVKEEKEADSEEPEEESEEESEEETEEGEESGEDSKEKLEKHEKTVDDLLKDLESMKS